MKQKLVRVVHPDTADKYIEQGWTIKQISAAYDGGCALCYMLLEKYDEME